MEVRRSTRILAAIVVASFAMMSLPVRALALSFPGDAAQGQTCNLHGGKCRHAAGQACTHTCHLQIPEEKKEAPSCPLHAAKENQAADHSQKPHSEGAHKAPALPKTGPGSGMCQITACAPGDEIASLPGFEPTMTCDPVRVSFAGPSSSVVVVRLPSPVSLDTGPPTPPPRS
ncbi:MAG: hypothetical protein HYR98_04995 [Nitrospirae bacterium]|nr:hypothetical protein [Nitrospirota bacterium]